MKSINAAAPHRLVVGLTTLTLLTFVASGCSGYVSPRFGGAGDSEEPGYDQQVDGDDYEPAPDPPADDGGWKTESSLGGSAAGPWSCTYSPTYDRDWHNDVICRNGAETQRPSLREWDSYVTQDEIMESAREYEAQLNAG